MSFDQLPDELVSLVASELNDEDMINFLQTQKRIHNICKRNKLDKPKIDELYFVYKTGHLICTAVKNNTEYPLYSSSDDFWDKKFEIMKKFRTINSVVIGDLHNYGPAIYTVDDSVLQRFIALNTKIEKLQFFHLKVDVTAEIFLQFSKTFQNLSVRNCPVSSSIMCDDVLLKVIKNTSYILWDSSPYIRTPSNITDRFLDELMMLKEPILEFTFTGHTRFTVAGIRRFIEKAVNIKRNLHVYFGILDSGEKEAAREWDTHSKLHPHLLYALTEYHDGWRYLVDGTKNKDIQGTFYLRSE